jgi:hypothetical protein
MRPVSDALLATVRGSHGMAARVRVVTTYQEGTNPDGVDIPIVAGDVQLDATADIRSTVDLTTDPTKWPAGVADLVTPYGNELFVERGVKIGGGVVEWVSQGYHRIDTVGQADAPKGAVRIAGKDRMAGIVDGRLVAPRQFAATASYGDIVTDLIRDIYPAATIEWDDDTYLDTAGRAGLVAEEDRFGFLNELIKSAGKIWYWDHRGVLVIRDLPDQADPVYEISHGKDGVLVKLDQEITRDEVYNGVVATGQAADDQPPARAVVVDNWQSSPTVWGGRFGKVPRFYSSTFITTDTQAASAALSLLRQSVGLPYQVNFAAVPNPALEPHDPIKVRYSGQRGAQTHVVETLTIPLTAADAMIGRTREQTFVDLAVT